MDDAELVTAARRGSVSAFTAIFDRHAPGVHDLALAVLRDRRAATEVVEATFDDARRRLADLAEGQRLAVWLLAIARRQAALRAGVTAGGDRRPEPSDDDDPERARLATLVWEAVADLALPDRTLVDLELRHGLAGRDLADALGVPLSEAEDLERRLHAIDRDLSGHLVGRATDRPCHRLARLLHERDGAARQPGRIGSHVDRCRACTQAAASLPPPLSLYASGPTAPLPAAARHAPLVVLKLLPEVTPEPGTDTEPDPAHEPWRPVPDAGTRPAAATAAGQAELPQPTPEAWTTEGFPPPSFPAQWFTAPERPPPSTSGGRHGRRRWPLAAALLGALLLLAGALVVRHQDDQRTALRLDPTTTSTGPEATIPPEATTVPGDETAPAMPPAPAPTAPGPPGPTAPGPPGPSASGAPPTAAPRPASAPGVLVAVLDTLRLPTLDMATGPQHGALPLRNAGASPLSYATRSSFAGLTVDKPTGTIGPGATLELTVTLDGAKAREGPFSGTLTFDGSGGTRQVAVASKVGRRPVLRDDAGEACTIPGTPCSRVLQLVPGPVPEASPTLCNTPWRYSIHVEDESQLTLVQADANLGDRDAQLRKDGATTGSAGLWQSAVFPPLPVATSLDVTIRAVDEFDFSSVRTERAIVC